LFSCKANPQTVFFLGYSDNSQGSQGYPLTQSDRAIFARVGYAWLFPPLRGVVLEFCKRLSYQLSALNSGVRKGEWRVSENETEFQHDLRLVVGSESA